MKLIEGHITYVCVGSLFPVELSSVRFELVLLLL